MRIRFAVTLLAALLVCTACFANPSDPASSAAQSPPPPSSSSAVELPASSSEVSVPSSSAPVAPKPSSSEAPVPASSAPPPVEVPAVEPVASAPPKAPAPSQPDTPQAASSAPAQASPDKVPGVPPISGAAEEELQQARKNAKNPIPIKSTITMTFEDENGKPLAGLTIDIDINARETADHTEEVLLLGETDANGQIKWQNPDLGVHNISAYGKTHNGLFPLDVLKHQDTQLKFTVSAA